MRTVMPVTMTHHNVRRIPLRMALDILATRPRLLEGSTCSSHPKVAIPVETLVPSLPPPGILARRSPSPSRIPAIPLAASRPCRTNRARIPGYTGLRDPWPHHTGNLPSSPPVVWDLEIT